MKTKTCIMIYTLTLALLIPCSLRAPLLETTNNLDTEVTLWLKRSWAGLTTEEFLLEPDVTIQPKGTQRYDLPALVNTFYVTGIISSKPFQIKVYNGQTEVYAQKQDSLGAGGKEGDKYFMSPTFIVPPYQGYKMMICPINDTCARVG